MKAKRIVCIAVMLVGLCGGAMAQKSIDKMLEDMERTTDARVTSIKRRDPETRKIVKLTKTIRLTSEAFAKKALLAFEKEEENALTSIKEKRSKVEYTLTFKNKTEKRTYILTIRQHNDVEVSVFITLVDDKKTGRAHNISLNKMDMQLSQEFMDNFKLNMNELKVKMKNAEKLHKKMEKRVHKRIETHRTIAYVDGKVENMDLQMIDRNKSFTCSMQLIELPDKMY